VSFSLERRTTHPFSCCTGRIRHRFINKEQISMTIKYLISAGLAAVVTGIAVIVFAVGGGTARTRPSQSVPAASAVSVRSTSLGDTLVDAKGRTLYLFVGDRPNVSRLSSAGLSVWPRFVAVGPVTAENGVQTAKLGRTTSPSGVPQVTYNGHPLYYYVGDSKPGSTRGQALNEFGALWYVLRPVGDAVTTASRRANAAPAATTPGSGY
jgi:predicted lipoprotein with Yx(FWY)xxD motif